MKKSDPTTLTNAEIQHRTAEERARRDAVTTELQAIYADAARNGFSSSMNLIDEDERRARAMAKSRLAGTTLEMAPVPPSMTREKELFIERRSIDLVLKVLGDEMLKVRALAALQWHAEHSDEWKELCRQTTLIAVRLAAIERRTAEMVRGIDPEYTPPMLMSEFIGRGAVADVPVGDLKKAALAKDVVTQSEIEKAEKL